MKLKKFWKLYEAFYNAHDLMVGEVTHLGPRMYKFVDKAEKHLPALFDVALAAIAVINNWERGDLALHVRTLRKQLEMLK